MEKGKKQEEKEWEVAFACFPELKRVFEYYDKQIRFYNCYKWEEGVTKEMLIQKRDRLFALAKNLGNQDLLILYYLKSVQGISNSRFLYYLQNLYQAETDLYSALRQESEGYDVMKITPCGYKGGRGKKRE